MNWIKISEQLHRPAHIGEIIIITDGITLCRGTVYEKEDGFWAPICDYYHDEPACVGVDATHWIMIDLKNFNVSQDLDDIQKIIPPQEPEHIKKFREERDKYFEKFLGISKDMKS